MKSKRYERAFRTTVFLLAALFLSFSVIGCVASQSETTSPPETAKTTGADVTTTAATTAVETTAGQLSAYGVVLPEDQLEYINYDSAIPIVKEGHDVTLKIVVTLDSGYPNNIMKNWFWEFVEDQIGINVDVEEAADPEKISLLFASNTVPDLFMGYYFNEDEQVKYGMIEGQLLAYNHYLESYMPSLQAFYDSDPDAIGNYIAPDGNMYGFPRIVNDTTVVGSYIRQSWLDILDLPQPKTLDEFTQTMIAFRDAGPDTLGIERVIPIGGAYEGWGNPMGVLFEAMGYLINPYWKDWDVAAGFIPCLRSDDSGDHYGLPVMDDLFYDAMVVQNQWYEEELLNPEFFTADDAQVNADSAAGYVGWVNTNNGINDSPDGQAGFRMLAPLTSPNNSVPKSANFSIYGRSNFIIGTTDYPEVCCRFIDLFFNHEWDYVMMHGPIEGKHPTYGYKGYSYGDPENTGEDSIYIEGEENYNQYKNEKLMPTFMDQATLYTYATAARWKSAVSGKHVEPDSVDTHIAKLKENYESDPEKYKHLIFEIEMFSARGAYSGNGVYPPLAKVYRTPDVNEKVADLKAALSPFIQEQVALFIAGRRSLDEIKTFQDELRAMGIDEYTEILSDEYANYLDNLE